MQLKNKNAIIYGAGGSIGGAVAKAFAAEGANVFLTGKTQAKLDEVAKAIADAGGFAETAIIDALDEKSVSSYVDVIIAKAGSIDISFNAVGLKDLQGTDIIDMSLEDFLRPVTNAMKTQFVIAKAVGRQMVKQGSGVMLSITASPGGLAYQKVGGFGPACTAIEGFCRNLAAELGPHGVRIICLRSAGSPDSAVFIEALKGGGALAKLEIDKTVDETMLKRLPVLSEIANVAVFMASDKASGITGAIANVTCGTTIL